MVMDLIQKKISPGEKVKFLLKTGREIRGIVNEITDQYVSVHNDEEVIVVLEEFIGGWETGNDSEEFSGLAEDTVVEKVEFDWEENKTKDQTDSMMNFSSPSAKKQNENDTKTKLLYMVIGGLVTTVIIFIGEWIIG